MSNDLLMPSQYAEYKKIKKDVGDEKIAKIMHIFPYRYRLAKAFRGVIAPELGRSLMGYEAGLKVTLAYTAFENIHKVAKRLRIKSDENTNIDIRNSEVVMSQIIKNDRLKFLLKQNVEKKHHFIELEKCFSGSNKNLIPIARAIRNKFTHGAFTAGGAGLSTKASTMLMNNVADELLIHCDELFTMCVNALMKQSIS